MTLPLILSIVCAVVALVLFLLAVVVYRNAVTARDRLIDTMVDLGRRPRCPNHPIDQLRCARPAGHAGRHMVDPADVTRAGFHPVPF